LDDKVALSAGDQDLIGADMAAEAGIGPILHLRGVDGRVVRLRALVVCREAEPAPTLSTEAGGTIAGRTLLRFAGLHALAYDFELPLATETGYSLDGVHYPLRTDFIGDLRLAFVSCNGQESDDRKRDIAERDALWHRLAQQHAQDPFHLLLQGGDQIYADEVANLHALERHRPVAAWRRHRSADAGPKGPQVATAALGSVTRWSRMSPAMNSTLIAITERRWLPPLRSATWPKMSGPRTDDDFPHSA